MTGQVACAVLATGATTDDDDVVVPVTLGDGRATAADPCGRRLDQALQGLQIAGDLGTVDDAVVGRDGQRHAGLRIGRDGQNGGDTGCRQGIEERDPHHAHVRDHEGRVAELVRAQASVAGARDEALPVVVEFVEGTALTGPEHGHDETTVVGCDGHADIDLLALDDAIGGLVGPVHARHLGHGQGAGAGDGNRQRDTL